MGSRMTCRPNEVQASVDSEINFLASLGLLLLPHVGFMLIIYKVDNGAPGVTVVHVVTESGSINHGKLDLELLFLEFSLADFNFC